jgi:hypothetical protein
MSAFTHERAELEYQFYGGNTWLDQQELHTQNRKINRHLGTYLRKRESGLAFMEPYAQLAFWS